MTSDELQRVRRLMSEGSTEQYHPKAFISHATLDHPFVEKFAADLRANGVDAWFSKWEIKPGDSIRAKIEEGLEGCEYFIIVLSKNSINRPWVQTELDAATIRKLNGKVRKIIPVKIEDCGDLPPTLASLLWEDFSTQPYHSAIKRILYSIFEIDTRPPIGSPPTVTTSDLVRFQITTLTGEDETTPDLLKKPSPSTEFPIHINALGAFANDLRREGFDARTDLFNGQVGLIVGPKGLDPKRMPPETAGLFFPLWELNHSANRTLVAARQFHEVFENRPSDWQFNRPYQQKGTALQPSREKRNWSRSASLLGNRDLEDSIQQELTRRFPASAIPVNIDVVGDQGNTWAMVQINDFNAGIDEKVKAVPEDFLGRGGLMAAALTAAQTVISELQKAGRIPMTNMQEGDKAVHFQSKCPKCANPTTQTFRTGELKNLLETDELKLYCIRCDHQWKPEPQESLNLEKWLQSKPRPGEPFS